MLNKVLKSTWWLLKELVHVGIIVAAELLVAVLAALLLLCFIPQTYPCAPQILQPGLQALPVHPVLQVLREYQASLGTTFHPPVVPCQW